MLGWNAIVKENADLMVGSLSHTLIARHGDVRLVAESANYVRKLMRLKIPEAVNWRGFAEAK